ncbi:hypothetical protein [Alteribacter aurantiacus]|uniref:hypothetical protein n=1 Tax=Alteribacter aurantiacus TaxID=254410 RepID=UPI00042092D0|nr:hypothetical protein [Alteribacter aurantiacus]
MSYYDELKRIDVKRKEEILDVDALFNNPLIHREIKGNQVFKSLDIKRLWNKL